MKAAMARFAACAVILAVTTRVEIGRVAAPSTHKQAHKGVPSGARFGVWAINLCDNDICDRTPTYDLQLKAVARLTDSLARAHDHRLDLFGFSEAAASREGATFQYFVADNISCTAMARTQAMRSPRCFALHLRRGLSPDYTLQHGEVGIVAPPWFGVLNGAYRELSSGEDHNPTRVHRGVLLRRFVVGDEGYVLPFYSTHLTGERIGELRDLIETIKAWYQPGDLTPIVVGDFNFGRLQTGKMAALKEYFHLAGEGTYADEHIMHVWFGKVSKFPESLGEVTYRGYSWYEQFNDTAANLVDHGAPYTEFSTPEEDCVAFSPASLVLDPYRGSPGVFPSFQRKNWRILVDGFSIWKFEGANANENEAAARQVRDVIDRYEINAHCHVGRPFVFLNYYLVSGRPPTGRMTGETCQEIDMSDAELRRDVSGNWAIVQSTTDAPIFDFRKAEGAARRALVVLQHYDFRYKCVVGSGQGIFPFYYWRR